MTEEVLYNQASEKLKYDENRKNLKNAENQFDELNDLKAQMPLKNMKEFIQFNEQLIYDKNLVIKLVSIITPAYKNKKVVWLFYLTI